MELRSDSNRMFVRLHSTDVNSRPDVKLVYSLVREGERRKY